jgi:hypothetical protein
MLTPSTVQIWLTEQAVPLALILGMLIIGFLVLKLSVAHHRRILLRRRAGHTEDSFVNHLSNFGFDPAIARDTYRYLQHEQNVPFPIFVTDLLDEDLGLGLKELEQSKQVLVSQSNRVLLPGIRHEPILTVEDLIRFVQASPRKRRMVA